MVGARADRYVVMSLAVVFFLLASIWHPCAAEPVDLDQNLTGQIDGDELDAVLTGRLGPGGGNLSGAFTARPQVVDSPAMAAVIFTMMTYTTLMPANASPGESLYELTGGTYQATRTYTFPDYPRMGLTSSADVTTGSPVLVGDTSVNGSVPAAGSDNIRRYEIYLTPRGAGKVLDSGLIKMNSGLVVRWEGSHEYNGEALSRPYAILVDWTSLSLEEDTFQGLFKSVARRPCDSDGDNKVDGADLAVWQQNYDPLGVNDNVSFRLGDWSGDFLVDGGDLAIWQINYDPLGLQDSGAAYVFEETFLATAEGVEPIPEPGTLLLVGLGTLVTLVRRRSRG